MLKKISIWFLTVISVIIVGYLLISTAYLIDTPNLDENLLESREVFSKEADHENIGSNITGTLDNATDAHMLLIAGYRGEENVFEKAVNNYYNLSEGNTPYDQLSKDNTGKETKKDGYYRYWHGYILFLRPLLALFNYKQIRIINTIFHIIILGLLIYFMIKNKLGIFIIPFLSAYIIMNPVAMWNSLQNSTIWYITCIGIIAYLLFKDKIIENKLHYILFTVVGMITSYMDFLTYPITTLGLLLIVVLLSEDLSFSNQIKRILICGISWVLGYGIMWGTKWILAILLIGGEDVIQNIIRAITSRSSSLDVFSKHFSRIWLIKDMMLLFKFKLTYIIISLNLILLIGILIYNLIKHGPSFYGIVKKNNEKNLLKKYDFKLFGIKILNSLPVLSISLVTAVWYFVMASHTQIHPFLSFRTAYSLWVAVLAWGYKIVSVRSKD